MFITIGTVSFDPHAVTAVADRGDKQVTVHLSGGTSFRVTNTTLSEVADEIEQTIERTITTNASPKPAA